jgi:hypothetical protein
VGRRNILRDTSPEMIFQFQFFLKNSSRICVPAQAPRFVFF